MLLELLMQTGAAVLLPVMLVCHFARFHSVKKTLLYTLFALYLCEMCSLVGLPSVTYIRFDVNVNWIPLQDIWEVHSLLNVLLFVPLGFFLPMLWQRWSLKQAALEGFFLSLTIELLQIFTFRATDINDLITNTLGTILGYCLALAVKKCFPRLPIQGWKSSERFELYAIVLATMLLAQPLLNNIVYGAIYG